MSNIILLTRNHYSDRYSSVEQLFDGEYNIYQLIEMFPAAYLFLINDDTEYNNSSVIGRDKLKKLFKINRNNTMPCQKCNSQMPATSLNCPRCGYENKYYGITKYLDPAFTKSAEIRNYVLYGFWADTEHRDV